MAVEILLLVIFFAGFCYGAALGFVWRPHYDSWFNKLWLRLLRKVGI